MRSSGQGRTLCDINRASPPTRSTQRSSDSLFPSAMKLNECNSKSGSRARTAMTIAEESIPPDSAKPTGTSLLRWRRTLSMKRERRQSAADSNDRVDRFFKSMVQYGSGSGLAGPSRDITQW